MDVLVESLLDEVLRFVAGQVGDSGVQEDEPQVQGRSEHEHVGMEFQFGDGRRRERMAYSHQAQILKADAAIATAATPVARVHRIASTRHRERTHF